MYYWGLCLQGLILKRKEKKLNTRSNSKKIKAVNYFRISLKITNLLDRSAPFVLTCIHVGFAVFSPGIEIKPLYRTKLENLAWFQTVFSQFTFCRKRRFMKPLLLSSIAILFKIYGVFFNRHDTMFEKNLVFSFPTLLLKHCFIYW